MHMAMENFLILYAGARVCMCVLRHTCMAVRGQVSGVVLLPPVGSGD